MAATLRTLYTALMVLSSAASICGNLLLLTVLLLNKDLRSDTTGLIVSFSLSDLALGLSTIPFGAHTSLTQPSGFPSDGIFCQGSGFIFLLLLTSSIHSLTWATVDKFSEICFALSYRRIWTTGRSRVVLLVIWLFSLLNATLPLVGFGSYNYSEQRFLCCPSFRPENRSFVLLWVLLGILVPIITMCSLYGYIVYVARKQARRGTFVCNELHCFYVPANTYMRSSVVMVANTACLLLCWTPFISVCLYETLSGQQTPSLTSALSTWLVLTSSALNPWITCMTQIRYRGAVRRSVGVFIHRCSCSDTHLEPHPQSSTLHHHPSNRISTTMTTSSSTQPPSSPSTTTTTTAAP